MTTDPQAATRGRSASASSPAPPAGSASGSGAATAGWMTAASGGTARRGQAVTLWLVQWAFDFTQLGPGCGAWWWASC